MPADPLNPERSSYVNSESPIRTCLNRKPTRFLRKTPGRPVWKIVIDPRRRGSLRVRNNIHDNLLGPLIFSAGSGLSSFTIRSLKEAMDEADYRCVGLSLGGKDGKLCSDVTTNLGDVDMRIEWISGRVIGKAGLYSCCSATRILEGRDGRCSSRSGVMGFLHAIRIYNKVVPRRFCCLHTQQRTQNYVELT